MGGVCVPGLSASAARGGCDADGGEGGAARGGGGGGGTVFSCPGAVGALRSVEASSGLVEAAEGTGLLAVGRSGDWCASVGSCAGDGGSGLADGLGDFGAASGGGSMVYEALATLDCSSCPFQVSLCGLEVSGFGLIDCNACVPFT
jgi:hypothetical protein